MTAATPAKVNQPPRQAWPPLLHRLVRTVRTRRLFEPGQHLLVAISGGPDSVALLALLHRLAGPWRLTLTAAHCNYGLRGDESEEDERFVAALCRRLDVPLIVRRLDVRSGGRRGSIQAVARDLRYRAFLDIARECGADRVALGHTADDQAETVLLWMLRGAGLTGLAGMPAARGELIVRPLYDSAREDVLSYLSRSGLSYRRDSTNEKPLYARNRVRHEVLPVLKRLVPSAVRALCRSADLCREDDRFLDAHLAALCEGRLKRDSDGSWAVERRFIRQLPRALQRRLIRELLRRCDPRGRAASARAVEEVLHAIMAAGANRTKISGRYRVTEKEVRCLPPGHALSKENHAGQAPFLLPIPSSLVWAGTGQTIAVQQLAPSHVGGEFGPRRIVVDAERVSRPLIVRAWRPGDRFHPLGMKGRSKKLQDFFTDLKVPMEARRRIPIVAAPEGIVWVVGYRQDERWAATAETRICLLLTAGPESQAEGAS
ncbi:tRNA lysidine(34) synthetase TilS [Nitrospira moscoviensis]|uniref:tRNA(Ile)-lysidine synthase n=1 Tax=Nitrospira moscoviensis TaxID=42253 RepID=A0A0K2GB77_NITMO|nr:tRNA lysidine(34) synthetase TilS [Nitrospira moscoviensis]ALA58198.1 tRNA(Ile)-lysidine synthase [Nitrospira moscoviensis]